MGVRSTVGVLRPPGGISAIVDDRVRTYEGNTAILHAPQTMEFPGLAVGYFCAGPDDRTHEKFK
jgi:hypothetical protein